MALGGVDTSNRKDVTGILRGIPFPELQANESIFKKFDWTFHIMEGSFYYLATVFIYKMSQL